MANNIRIDLVDGAYAVLSYVPPDAIPLSNHNWSAYIDQPRIKLTVTLPTGSYKNEHSGEIIPVVVLAAFTGGEYVLGEKLDYKWGNECIGTSSNVYTGNTLKEAEESARQALDRIEATLQGSVDKYKDRLSQREAVIKSVLSECGEITPE